MKQTMTCVKIILEEGLRVESGNSVIFFLVLTTNIAKRFHCTVSHSKNEINKFMFSARNPFSLEFQQLNRIKCKNLVNFDSSLYISLNTLKV